MTLNVGWAARDPDQAKRQPRWPPWRLLPCGTEAAYRRHRRRGEPADQACLEAAARAARRRRR